MSWILPFLPIAAGFAADLAFGDPAWLYHPVRLIGKAIEVCEQGIRRALPDSAGGQLLGGGLLVICILLFSFGLPWALLWMAGRISPWLSLLLECILCYQILAIKSLRDESMKVYNALKHKTLDDARQAVAMIVGRDTQNLSAEQVAKAAIETVAENTSDGTVAPLLFMALGSICFGCAAPFGFLYKGINTMDSMVGYKNDRYLYFGRAAARLDDLANWIPARLAGRLMIAAAALAGLDAKHAAKVFVRDRRNHASPNSAQTEAACAGALNIQLAGNAYYFGKLYEKPTIGDALRPVEYEDIIRACRLLYITAALCLLLCAAAFIAAAILRQTGVMTV